MEYDVVLDRRADQARTANKNGLAKLNLPWCICNTAHALYPWTVFSLKQPQLCLKVHRKLTKMNFRWLATSVCRGSRVRQQPYVQTVTDPGSAHDIKWQLVLPLGHYIFGLTPTENSIILCITLVHIYVYIYTFTKLHKCMFLSSILYNVQLYYAVILYSFFYFYRFCCFCLLLFCPQCKFPLWD